MGACVRAAQPLRPGDFSDAAALLSFHFVCSSHHLPNCFFDVPLSQDGWQLVKKRTDIAQRSFEQYSDFIRKRIKVRRTRPRVVAANGVTASSRA